MAHITITVDASRYADHDDCLAAAERDAQREYSLPGWDLSPRWADDDRSAIAIDLPDHAVARSLSADVAAIVGHGDGDEIRATVDNALRCGITSAAEIADIVRESREEWAREKGRP